MKVAGLFAGIGGFELGLASAGHQTKLLCDIDPLARSVLDRRFRAEIIPDVKDVSLDGSIDVVTSGFPCQDLSQVGTGRGIAGEKSGTVRHLFRILRKTRVPWVIIENVPFMLRLDRGHAMTYLVNGLQRLGYNWAYRVIDAQAFGLPQRRRRVFIVAAYDRDPRPVLLSSSKAPPEDPGKQLNGSACGFYWTEGNRGLGWAHNAVPPLKGGSSFGIVSAPAIVHPSGRVVLPDIRDGERLQGFRSNWTSAALEEGGRLGDRWRLVGNAVNVRVAKWIGERLATAQKEYDASGDLPLSKGQPWPNSAWSYLGEKRIANCSQWPVKRKSPDLANFLLFDGSPLSYRATEGFRQRLVKSSLRVDSRFVSILEKHAASVRHL